MTARDLAACAALVGRALVTLLVAALRARARVAPVEHASRPLRNSWHHDGDVCA